MKCLLPIIPGILALAVFPSCMAPNMNRTPDRWVQVIDSARKQPVKGLAVIYQEFGFGWLVRPLLTSREYVSDHRGQVHVPSGVLLQPAPGSGYFRDTRIDAVSTGDIKSRDALFVISGRLHGAETR